MTTNCTALNSTDNWSTTSAVDPGTGSTAMETWTENLDNLDTTKRMGPVPTTIYTLIGLVGKKIIFPLYVSHDTVIFSLSMGINRFSFF